MCTVTDQLLLSLLDSFLFSFGAAIFVCFVLSATLSRPTAVMQGELTHTLTLEEGAVLAQALADDLVAVHEE